jgi:hypothetical protein
MTSFSLLLFVISLTLAFEFSNGWHDAANSIATVVSTRVLTPLRAVAWAAFWNFVAAFFFGTAVAGTIGKGMVHIEMVNQQVLLSGLLGAIIWNLITRRILGLPTSSSRTASDWWPSAAQRWQKRLRARSSLAAGLSPSLLFFFFAADRHAPWHDRHHRHELDRSPAAPAESG